MKLHRSTPFGERNRSALVRTSHNNFTPAIFTPGGAKSLQNLEVRFFKIEIARWRCACGGFVHVAIGGLARLPSRRGAAPFAALRSAAVLNRRRAELWRQRAGHGASAACGAARPLGCHFFSASGLCCVFISENCFKTQLSYFKFFLDPF